MQVRGALVQLGPDRIDPARWDWAEVDRNPFFCPEAQAAARWAAQLEAVRKAGSSTGAVIELAADGVPPGPGAHVHGKLDADLAAALMSISAVEGVGVGDGFAAAGLIPTAMSFDLSKQARLGSAQTRQGRAAPGPGLA